MTRPPAPQGAECGNTGAASRPDVADIPRLTDHYFLRTKEIVGRYGDRVVTYAVFMRRPVLFTPRLAVEWIERMAAERGQTVKIELNHAEGEWVGAGEPLMYITGSF